MAKQEISYICETCGSKYQKQAVAEQCEGQHYVPIQITGYSYDKKEQKKEFPLSINVKVRDGDGKERVITYNRK